MSENANLALLMSHPPGTYHKLENMLHDRVVEFMTAMMSPTAHKHHWEQRATNTRLLFKHYCQLHSIYIAVYSTMHDNPKAFTIAWDRYVALHCKPHEITAAQQYPSDVHPPTLRRICYFDNGALDVPARSIHFD